MPSAFFRCLSHFMLLSCTFFECALQKAYGTGSVISLLPRDPWELSRNAHSRAPGFSVLIWAVWGGSRVLQPAQSDQGEPTADVRDIVSLLLDTMFNKRK